MFPNLKQAEKKPDPNAGTELEPGRECSQILGTGNFPDFLGKILVPWKWHSGMQIFDFHHPQPVFIFSRS